MSMGGVKLTALLDTGFQVTLIQEKMDFWVMSVSPATEKYRYLQKTRSSLGVGRVLVLGLILFWSRKKMGAGNSVQTTESLIL